MLTIEQRTAKIVQLAAFPPALRRAVEGLADSQLDTPYRDGGWTPRQVVHHVVDSHANGYLRCRWVVSDNNPIIKTYDQEAWQRTGEHPEHGTMSLDDFLEDYSAHGPRHAKQITDLRDRKGW